MSQQTQLDWLLSERDALLVVLERARGVAAMPETRRALERVTREIRGIDPDAVPRPVDWAQLPFGDACQERTP